MVPQPQEALHFPAPPEPRQPPPAPHAAAAAGPRPRPARPKPPPLKIRLLKPHSKKQPGHLLTHDYHEAVTLINAGVAEQAR